MTSHLNDGLRRGLALGAFFLVFFEGKKMKQRKRRITRILKKVHTHKLEAEGLRRKV